MKVIFATGAAALALAACSPDTRNESAEAGNAIAADTGATTRNAVDDVDAATDRALGDAGAAMDNSGARIEAGADRAGVAIEKGADRAAAATGEALRDAGNRIDR
jgi:hypothetical protein